MANGQDFAVAAYSVYFNISREQRREVIIVIVLWIVIVQAYVHGSAYQIHLTLFYLTREFEVKRVLVLVAE